MNKKLGKLIFNGVATAALVTGAIAGVTASEKNNLNIIEKGVMEICGDEAHVEKVKDYYYRAAGWNREPDSPQTLVKRHERICPGYGKDY